MTLHQTDAWELVRMLESGDPAVHTRNHDLENGVLEIDFRTLRRGEAHEVAQAIRRVLIEGSLN